MFKVIGEMSTPKLESSENSRRDGIARANCRRKEGNNNFKGSVDFPFNWCPWQDMGIVKVERWGYELQNSAEGLVKMKVPKMDEFQADASERARQEKLTVRKNQIARPPRHFSISLPST